MHAHRTVTTLTCSLVSDLFNQCMCHADIGLVSCVLLASIDSVLSIYCQHNTHINCSSTKYFPSQLHFLTHMHKVTILKQL